MSASCDKILNCFMNCVLAIQNNCNVNLRRNNFALFFNVHALDDYLLFMLSNICNMFEKV